MIFDILENLEMYAAVVPQLKTVASAMDHDEIYDKAPGKYSTFDPHVTYRVMEVTPTTADVPFVFHKKQTVVSIVLSGAELASTTWRELKNQASYDSRTDTGFFQAEPISVLHQAQGRFAVFLPGEPYKTGVAYTQDAVIKKVEFCIIEE